MSGGVGHLGTVVALVVARDGRLPVGADEAVTEAGGTVVVVGSGTEDAARSLPGADRAWWAETGPGLRPASLSRRLAPVLGSVALVILPASADGRDLAPRLAAELGRPLVAHATGAVCRPYPGDGDPHRVRATVSRLDDRVLLPVEVDGPAVVTLVPGSRAPSRPDPTAGTGTVRPLGDIGPAGDGTDGVDAEVTAILEPDLHTMDLADAARVVAGGAGLAVGGDDRDAAQLFGLLVQVAAAMGGSAGATRVATDAGWTGYERQIGTTGVAIDPDLYIAFGVSGAAQHVGGIGSPRHIVSVNTDASSPMTAMADLGLVTDARSLLVELGRRFGVGVADAAVAPGRERGPDA